MNLSTIRTPLFIISTLALAACGGESGDPGLGDTDGEGMATGGELDGGSTDAEPEGTTGDEPVGSTGEVDSEGMDESSGGESSGDESSDSGAAEAPTVVETIPVDGALGVEGDASLVVRFSEPMDMASVQAAYQSADIPAGTVTFEWNDAGDELTIIPNEPLPYAYGSNPMTVTANAFAYTITTVAESADGVALEAPVDVEFSTLRRIAQHFERLEEWSGSLRDDGVVGVQPYLGDYTLDEHTRRYLLTFDLVNVPFAAIHSFEQAQMSASWSSELGDPWVSMGGVLYRHVSYGGLVPESFDGPTHSNNYALFSLGSNHVAVDVTAEMEAVIADVATFDERLQFRLRWAIENNFDMDHDGVVIDEDLLELELQYLAR